jgi:hypothetical protein
MLEGVLVVVVVAVIALVVGLGFGRVIGARAIGRLADRADADEEPRDRPA